MDRKITFKGKPLTLTGNAVKMGDTAPKFNVVDKDLNGVSLDNFKGKVKVVTFFPSLDTPVCDLQVKEFNKRASGISQDVVVIGISKDLPFAQARFCSENDIKNVHVYSDYKDSSFGTNFGVLIKELNLLARGVAIIGKDDKVKYFKIVEELTTPPDYDDALKALDGVLKN